MAKKKVQKNPPAAKPAETVARPAQPKVNSYAAAPALPPQKWWVVPLFALLFFIGHLFTSVSTIKPLVLVLIALTVATCFIKGSQLKERLSWPVIAVFAWVVMNGISMFYAVSGKFALREFLKLMAGFCVFLLVLAWSKPGERGRRTVASILEGSSALGALVSIDMISTHWISGPFYKFLELFSSDYIETSVLSAKAGSRIYTYTNANVFAAITGIAIMLGLELAVTERNQKNRQFHLVCLFLNALGFLLAFSMGASGAIAVGFLVFLFIERREQKGKLLILMVEALLLVVAAAFPIFRTSFNSWDGVQPIPLLCSLAGATLLCISDWFVGQPFSSLLKGKNRIITVIIPSALSILLVYTILAVNISGPIHIQNGNRIDRADYPAPGSYFMSIDASGPVRVTIASQNQVETMMDTHSTLYSGPANGASYTVPEDSKVVFYYFFAQEDLVISSVSYSGMTGHGNVMLNYKLLPGFIANRLQGFFANHNFIQRTVYFEDGMKLFRKSPIIGLGLGAFESAICSVQSYHYETKYAHNHYIETLLDTGAVGFILFVGMLFLSAFVLWKAIRKDDGSPLAPGLLAALIFMAIHAAVEIDFSSNLYLPYAFGFFALVCLTCGEELPFLPDQNAVHTGVVLSMALLSLGFAVTLYLNMRARDIALNSSASKRYSNLELCDKIDLYEWTDYELTYVYLAQGIDQVNEARIFAQANRFAEKLSRVNSNSIPPYLAEYYFSTDQRDPAYWALEKYVDYVTSDSEVWQTTFNILEKYSDNSETHRNEVSKLYEAFQAWNDEHLGTLKLTDSNLAYISSVTSQ